MIQGLENATKIESILAQIVGEKTWGVRLAAEREAHMFVEFGSARSLENASKRLKGKWRLLTYWCAWRLEKNGVPLIGSIDVPHLNISDNDSQELKNKVNTMQLDAQTQIQVLNDLTLVSVSVLSPMFDVKFSFSNEVDLYLISIVSKDDESIERHAHHWLFYLPDADILAAGPGSTWNILKPPKKMVSASK
ncbi:MAG: hypothetical protein AB1403_26730 [Candidatus Riflebacteria bacterium]